MDKIIAKLNSAKSIAVFPHKNEDPDALGSCFALALALRSIGKEVVIYVSGAVEKRLDFMGHDYVAYDCDVQYEHDLCVCVDCGSLERIGERAELFNQIGNTVNVDHHYSNTLFADENFVDGDASSAGQIIYELLIKMNIEITKEIAQQLYTAICSDTGCFKYSNVSPKTMMIAAELLKLDIDNAEIARLLFESEPLAAVQLKAEVAGRIESYYDGKLRMVAMTSDLYKKYNISEVDAPNLVDIPRMIENTEIAVCFKEQADGIRINLRSNGDCDVSVLADKFGGGGHIKAAGCTVKNMSLKEIKERIVEECSYLKEYRI